MSNPKVVKLRDISPPNPPWVPLDGENTERAPLSYYYSDHNSNVPIRDVSSESSCKADPNIETKTFGLFGTCVKEMRRNIVADRLSLHFFCTRRGNVRVLTGYYQYGWFYEIPASDGDFMLAAKEARFVTPGYRLSDLTGYLHNEPIGCRFHPFKYVEGETPMLLLKLLRETPDATAQYISEIHRLEQEILHEKGRIYFDRKRGFDWKEALRPMKLKP